jgi:hypothetical protein
VLSAVTFTFYFWNYEAQGVKSVVSFNCNDTRVICGKCILRVKCVPFYSLTVALTCPRSDRCLIVWLDIRSKCMQVVFMQRAVVFQQFSFNLS